MHSDHRRRYHLRPLADVHPGDRISLDPDAIAALRDADPGRVDWDQVDDEAREVLERHRPSPAYLSLDVRTPGRGRAVVSGPTIRELLVAKPDNPL